MNETETETEKRCTHYMNRLLVGALPGGKFGATRNCNKPARWETDDGPRCDKHAEGENGRRIGPVEGEEG